MITDSVLCSSTASTIGYTAYDYSWDDSSVTPTTEAKSPDAADNSKGVPVTNTIVAAIDSKTGETKMYYASDNGDIVMNRTVKLPDGNRIFATEDGSIAVNTLVTDSKGKLHFATENGTLAKSCRITVGDKRHKCNKSGKITKIK